MRGHNLRIYGVCEKHWDRLETFHDCPERDVNAVLSYKCRIQLYTIIFYVLLQFVMRTKGSYNLYNCTIILEESLKCTLTETIYRLRYID